MTFPNPLPQRPPSHFYPFLPPLGGRGKWGRVGSNLDFHSKTKKGPRLSGPKGGRNTTHARVVARATPYPSQRKLVTVQRTVGDYGGLRCWYASSSASRSRACKMKVSHTGPGGYGKPW